MPATAILMSALILHGINPGPQLIQDHPDIFWGLIASMYIGNVMLVILNLPLVGIFVNFLRIPYTYLAPTILLISICGVYGSNSNPVDIIIMAVFGFIGYILRKFRFDLAPLVMALVLGEKIELSFRRSLAISEGNLWIFFKSSFSKIFLTALLIIVLLQIVAWFFGFRINKQNEDS